MVWVKFTILKPLQKRSLHLLILTHNFKELYALLARYKIVERCASVQSVKLLKFGRVFQSLKENKEFRVFLPGVGHF